MNKNIPIVIVSAVIIAAVIGVMSLNGQVDTSEPSVAQTAQAEKVVPEQTVAIHKKVKYGAVQCDLLATMKRTAITMHMGIQDDLADTKAFSPNDKALIESLERQIRTSENGIQNYRITIANNCN